MSFQDFQVDQERGRAIAQLHGLCASVQTLHDVWMGDALGTSSIGPFADADYAGQCWLWRKLEVGLWCSHAHST